MTRPLTIGTRSYPNPELHGHLWCGSGGFRLGLQYASADRAAFPGVQVVRSRQGEPAIQKQWAAEIYRARWERDAMAYRNSLDVLYDAPALAAIAALAPDVLVGGFPCQDYSVAKPRGLSEGLEGNKGVLWWAIYRLLAHRRDAGCRVKYLCLERVDRLIASPGPFKGGISRSSSPACNSSAMRWNGASSMRLTTAMRSTVAVRLSWAITKAHRLRDVQSRDWLLTRGVLAQALPARMKGGDWLLLFRLPAHILAAGCCVGGGWIPHCLKRPSVA